MADSALKIDAFPHILPPRYFERLREGWPRAASNPNTGARPVLFDLDERFRMMDRYPGYVQVLTLAGPPIEDLKGAADPQELARLANDGMADLVRRYPDRFLGFAASVSLLDVDSAMVEMERAINDLGALGAQVYTNVNGHPLDEPRFAPVFERLESLNRTLWIHPARNADHPDYPSEDESKYFLYMRLGWPYETAVCISRLIFSGIMERHPRLNVLTHHAGGLIPHLAGRLVLHTDRPDLRKSAGIDDRFTPEYTTALYKRFYGDTVFSGAHHPLACALSFYGPDHILFGTDMPFGAEGGELFVRETIAAVEETASSDAERRQLFEGNARALLGLGD